MAMLWTADDVARELGISRQSVWRRTREGEIPAVPFGKRSYRYDPKQIQRLFETPITLKELADDNKESYYLPKEGQPITGREHKLSQPQHGMEEADTTTVPVQVEKGSTRMGGRTRVQRLIPMG